MGSSDTHSGIRSGTDAAPILVVGAGSTGLTLACALARHGAPVRIVDRLPGIAPFARATGVHSRSLEVLQDLGIADRIVAQSAPICGAKQFAGGELILHYRTDGLDSPFPFAASLEQWKVEEALEDLLGRLGVTVERETELIALEDDGGSVRATLRQADGATEVVETPWLVGCDGAHSAVRHLKGEHFPGEADPHRYLVADVVLDGDRTPDEVYVYLTDHGVLWLFPLPEGRSLLAADVPEPHGGAAEAPGLGDVQVLLDERAPGGVRASDPRWLSWFHIHYRVTPHYRHGRTFLAGDAAHIHSPIGGQGMNTGIQDAYNLAWKLALVVRSRAPATLLDSYEAERHAVAKDVLATTKAMTDKAENFVTMAPEQRARLYRHVMLPEADRLQMVRHTEELDLDYRRSPVCGASDAAGTPPLAGGPHAGAQVCDAHPLLLEGKTVTLFELLRGPTHTLVLLPGLEPARRCALAELDALAATVTRTYGDAIRVCIALPPDVDGEDHGNGQAFRVRDIEGALHRRYGAAGARLYLVRPDGYVGFRSEPPSREGLFRHLARVFTPPAGS